MAKQPLYSSLPAVPKKKIALTNPYPQGPVGVDVATQVPRKPPRLAGLAGKHGYGRLPHQSPGKLRLSGHPGAHRIGGKK